MCRYRGCPRYEQRNGLCVQHAKQADVAAPFTEIERRPGGRRGSKRGRIIRQPDGTALVPLLGTDEFTVIDAGDIDIACRCKRWKPERRSRTSYAKCASGPNDLRGVRLHTLLMDDPPEGATVDHIDRDGLNNRRSNLRYASASDQAQNRRPRSPRD